MSDISFLDPYNRERECGLSQRQLINLAKREGWPARKIYGRVHIGSRAYHKWLCSQPFVKREGRVFSNVNTGARWSYATRRQGSD